MASVIKKATSGSIKKQKLKSVQADYLREKDDHVEREKELIARINQIFNNEDRLKECLHNVLHELSLFTGRKVAEVWLSSIDSQELRLVSQYTSKGARSPAEKIIFNSATGLIGKAWKEQIRVTMDNLQSSKEFSRPEFAKANTLLAGTAIPILLKNETIAVLGFYINPEAAHQFPLGLSENVIAQ